MRLAISFVKRYIFNNLPSRALSPVPGKACDQRTTQAAGDMSCAGHRSEVDRRTTSASDRRLSPARSCSRSEDYLGRSGVDVSPRVA